MSNANKSAYDGAPKGGDTSFRKEWDTDEYAQKAKEREADVRRKESGSGKDKNINMKHGGLAVAREESLNLDSNVNKVVVVTAKDEAKGPGFHCQACNVTYRDNLSYLDHLNSPLHLQNSGISNRVARSTLEQVKARLATRKLREAPKDPKITFEERLKREEVEKLQKKQAKKDKKLQERMQDVVVDDQTMAMMGFGSFGSSSKS